MSIFKDLGIAEPTTHAEMVAAAKKMQSYNLVDYPIGGTYKAGWNLGEEFINNYLGNGGAFFGEGNAPSINNATGVATLNTMKSLTEYMDPEYLVSDSTYVQQQFQQGKVAMATLWATRAGAMDNAEESQVVGLVKMASAPMGTARPASRKRCRRCVARRTLVRRCLRILSKLLSRQPVGGPTLGSRERGFAESLFPDRSRRTQAFPFLAK